MKWGMGYGTSISGTTSDFRYSAPIPPESDKSQPYSGFYNGYFVFRAEIPKRIHERNVKLEFTVMEKGYQVIGVGTNEFGSFTLLGSYNPETKELSCIKEWGCERRMTSRYEPVTSPSKKRVKKLPPVKSKSAKKPASPKPQVKKEPKESNLQQCLTILTHLMVSV